MTPDTHISLMDAYKMICDYASRDGRDPQDVDCDKVFYELFEPIDTYTVTMTERACHDGGAWVEAFERWAYEYEVRVTDDGTSWETVHAGGAIADAMREFSTVAGELVAGFAGELVEDSYQPTEGALQVLRRTPGEPWLVLAKMDLDADAYL